ncbi:MAG: ParA family protein [Desulfobacteraceae bacterium]|nr:MAG: ParA family protein [Desulfobacteraceae bacterium]
MKTIAICNNKGGVGKTTICFCLAGALAELGKKVLAVDMDQQGSLSSSFLPANNDLQCTVADVILNDQASIREAILKTNFKNIDLVPSNLTLGRIETELLSERDAYHFLADKLEEIKSEYDVILLDSPPNLGLASWSVLTAADGVIIPLEAQDYSVKGTGFVHGLIQKVRRRANPNLKILGYVINRYDGRRRIEQDFKAMIEKHLEGTVFKQDLKDSVKYVEAVTLGKPITFLAPKSEQAEAIRSICREVIHAQKL